MSRIAVDIDSTLYDFETPAREAFTKLYEMTGNRDYLRGAYHPWTEWRSPSDSCGLETWLKVIELCHSEEIILAQRPFNGAVETCQALADEGHELLYISNRVIESAPATYAWLEREGFPLDHDIAEIEEWRSGHAFKTLTTEKRPFLKDCQYLIDDRPRTAVDFVYDMEWRQNYPDLKRKAFLLAYPYNQALTDIPNLYIAPSWAGINQYLVSKGVLTRPAYHALGV